MRVPERPGTFFGLIEAQAQTMPGCGGGCMGKCIIAVTDVLDAAKKGQKIIVAIPSECIVTPGARDKAAELGIVIKEGPGSPAAAPAGPPEADLAQTEYIVREVCALMRARLPAGFTPQDLERLVRSAVTARLEGSGSSAAPDAPLHTACVEGVCFINGTRLLEGGAGPVPVAEKVLIAEAIRCGDDIKLAGGYMEWQKAAFNRTVEFPEIGIVIEGELHLAVGGKNMVAKAGDMVYFPKGAQVAYSTPGRVRVACVNCIR
jgi:ethanolamine utilization protein EutQ